MDCAVGPDGSLTIVDLYRGILQHRKYVTTYLRTQVLERGLDTPTGLGRIWRIVWEGGRAPDHSPPALSGATSEELVARLEHRGGWWRDTAQRLLVERQDDACLEPLRALARTATATPLGRIHALWTLHGLGELDRQTVRAALVAGDARVRVQGLRTGARFREDAIALLDDPDPRVRVELMLLLGSLGPGFPLLLGEAPDPWLELAALATCRGRELELLQRLPVGDEHARLHRACAASAMRREPARVVRLLALAAADAESPRSGAVLDGILHVTRRKGWKRPRLASPRPAAPPAGLAGRWKEVVAACDWGAPAAAPERPALADDVVSTGARLFGSTCITCHGIDGLGLPGLGAPLAGSPYVLGDAERLVRIVLHGIHGPLTLDGREWNGTMPGHGASDQFTDENIAALLSWLRRQWGNRGPAVEPATVARVRAATAGRTAPWTVEELEALEPWEELFDGRTLAGWEKHGGKGTYRVGDGAIVGTTAPRSPNTFLCTTRHFGDFELELEFLVHPELNSGVQIRSHLVGDRVTGYQVEIDADTKRGRLWTAGIYDEARRGWLDDMADNQAAREALRPERWNHLRVVAEGSHLRTWLNGVPAADLIDDMRLLGLIGLQVHGVGKREDPLTVHWRNLRIRDRGRHVRVRDAAGSRLEKVPAGTGSLGRPAPEGAIQLVGPGIDLQAWRRADEESPPGWQLADGVLEVQPGAGSIQTRRAFQDFELHLEFAVPRSAKDAEHQARGNSGVYLQRRYEVQILDSAGREAGDRDCGALYGYRRPDADACLAPGQWQSYDIEFRAPRWNAAGEKTGPARITVLHNGVLVHDDVELSRKTGAGAPEGLEPGPILLQDHGARVRFRNVWVREE